MPWRPSLFYTPLVDGLRVNPGNPALREFEKRYRGEHGESQTPGQRQELSREARRALIDALLRIPAAVSFEGRSTLLIGIPWAQSVNRSPTNSRLDLEMIIDQLLSIGGTGSSSAPILVLLDNAESYVPGTEMAKLFRDTRRALEGKGASSV